MALVAGNLLGWTAAPALAAGTPTGNEDLVAPVSIPAGTSVGTTPYVAVEDANGNPIATDLLVIGNGWETGSSIYTMECDGVNPTTAGYQVVQDCDALTTGGPQSPGTEGWPTGQVQFPWTNGQLGPGIFRGVGPNDQFNCLAPEDDPTASTTNVPGNPSGAATIDPTVPSWGSTLPLAKGVGGGTASCQVRVGYNLTSYLSADKYFPVTLSQGPAASTPESPLTIALPIGGVVLFGAAGAILYRKRRSASAAA